jgi:hypothetical protein
LKQTFFVGAARVRPEELPGDVTMVSDILLCVRFEEFLEPRE